MVASDERPFDVIPFEVGTAFVQIHRLVVDHRTGHQGELEEAGLWVLWKCLQRCVLRPSNAEAVIRVDLQDPTSGLTSLSRKYSRQ